MRRRISSFAVTSAVTAALAVVPASPAAAHLAVCTAPSTITFDGPVTFPAVIPMGIGGPPAPAWFTASDDALCLVAPYLTMSGEFPRGAQCLRSAGYGSAWDGNGWHHFGIEWIGMTLIFTGGVAGQVNIAPQNGQQCRADTGGATVFDLDGIIALV